MEKCLSGASTTKINISARGTARHQPFCNYITYHRARPFLSRWVASEPFSWIHSDFFVILLGWVRLIALYTVTTLVSLPRRAIPTIAGLALLLLIFVHHKRVLFSPTPKNRVPKSSFGSIPIMQLGDW